MASPKIASVKWGQMELECAELPEVKDCKLYPGGARPWDWSETGTRHKPGVQQADVQDLVRAGAKEIVLSRGMDLKLEVPERTVQWLEEQGVKVHIAETREAVEMYNQLVEDGIVVGGLFHSTC